MPETPITVSLLRLGRLRLDPRLRGLPPGTAESGLVVTATVPVPESPAAERQHAWDVAWSDAAREASRLGADRATVTALPGGAGDALVGGTRVVVAAHGEVVLAQWLAAGSGTGSVRVGPLPHLQEAAVAAARRPAYVVVLADRDGTDVIAHAAGDAEPPRRFPAGHRPGAQRDPRPGRPPAQVHGPRHVTDSEPEDGGERNAAFVAGRVLEAADSVAAHVVLGAGDRHILEAVEGHLPAPVRPLSVIAGETASGGHDDRLGAAIGAALDEITDEAVRAAGERIASLASGPGPAAVRGIEAVAEQLAQQQVAVLLVAADLAAAADPGTTYRTGIRPTEFLVGDPDAGAPVPLEDGMVWAALHQDAIVAQLPGWGGPLAGEPAAALLRRGSAA